MIARREVIPLSAPAPSTASPAPVSIAVRGGAFIFVSGLTAIDLRTGERTPGTTASETIGVGEKRRRVRAGGLVQAHFTFQQIRQT